MIGLRYTYMYINRFFTAVNTRHMFNLPYQYQLSFAYLINQNSNMVNVNKCRT